LSTLAKPETISDVGAAMRAIGLAAREAARGLALASSEAKNAALTAAAAAIRSQTAAVLAANERDLNEAASAGVSAAFLDRLLLDPQRIEAIAKGLEEVARLPDPVGEVMARWTRPQWPQH
jgi:glutamate-5-semialdehyde dehydrogenase